MRVGRSSLRPSGKTFKEYVHVHPRHRGQSKYPTKMPYNLVPLASIKASRYTSTECRNDLRNFKERIYRGFAVESTSGAVSRDEKKRVEGKPIFEID